jgi:hypothetical protein
MTSCKKLTFKWTLRQVFICLRPRNPYHPPPPLHTVYVCAVYLPTQGRGEGGELNQREVKGATVHKAGSKIST